MHYDSTLNFQFSKNKMYNIPYTEEDYSIPEEHDYSFSFNDIDQLYGNKFRNHRSVNVQLQKNLRHYGDISVTLTQEEYEDVQRLLNSRSLWLAKKRITQYIQNHVNVIVKDIPIATAPIFINHRSPIFPNSKISKTKIVQQIDSAYLRRDSLSEIESLSTEDEESTTDEFPQQLPQSVTNKLVMPYSSKLPRQIPQSVIDELIMPTPPPIDKKNKKIVPILENKALKLKAGFHHQFAKGRYPSWTRPQISIAVASRKTNCERLGTLLKEKFSSFEDHKITFSDDIQKDSNKLHFSYFYSVRNLPAKKKVCSFERSSPIYERVNQLLETGQIAQAAEFISHTFSDLLRKQALKNLVRDYKNLELSLKNESVSERDRHISNIFFTEDQDALTLHYEYGVGENSSSHSSRFLKTSPFFKKVDQFVRARNAQMAKEHILAHLKSLIQEDLEKELQTYKNLKKRLLAIHVGNHLVSFTEVDEKGIHFLYTNHDKYTDRAKVKFQIFSWTKEPMSTALIYLKANKIVEAQKFISSYIQTSLEEFDRTNKKISIEEENRRFGTFKTLVQNLATKESDSYKGRQLRNHVDQIIAFVKNYEYFNQTTISGIQHLSKKDVQNFYRSRNIKEVPPPASFIYDPETKEWFVDKVRYVGSGQFKDVGLIAKITGGNTSLFANAIASANTSKRDFKWVQQAVQREAELGSLFEKGTRGINSYYKVVSYSSKDLSQEKTAFITEYCNGGELAEAIDRKTQALNSKEKQIVALDLIYGCKAMFDKGVASRDIKTANVMLQRNPLTKRVTEAKHIDFGHMCRTTDPDKITICGSPVNMASEVLLGTLDDDTDVTKLDAYSLGVTLLELILEELPYQLNGFSWHGIMNKRQEPAYETFVLNLTKGRYRKNNGRFYTPQNQQEQAILKIAGQCLVNDPKKRPSPQQMLEKLKPYFDLNPRGELCVSSVG